jgi:hypothetical protein
MKLLFTLISCFVMLIGHSQIRVDKAGDFWDKEVYKALAHIKEIDSTTYDYVVENVDRISFWTENYNTFEIVEGKRTLLISSQIMNKSLNNLSSTIVHESYHVAHANDRAKACKEELDAYLFEMSFLFKMKDAEAWLVEFVYDKIRYYKSLNERGDCK